MSTEKNPDKAQFRDREAPDDADVLDQFWNDLARERAGDSSQWLQTHGEDREDLLPQLEVLDLLFQARLADDESSADLSTPIPTPTPTPSSSSEEPALAKGSLLAGKLRILDQLDVGGMGEVYVAWHTTLETEVAVKVLPKRLARTPHAVKQFHAEMRAQAKIRGHENIVAVMDAGEDNERFYLVMEYVPGSNLRSLVRRNGPCPWRDACSYVRQAALGLAHAHSKGVLHRDVKPSNLIKTYSDTVKLVDWGLSDGAALQRQSETGGRQGLGTHDYVAPEQAADSLAAEARSDLYGLGATFFFLLTGRPPFAEATSSKAKLTAHQERAVPSVLRDQPDTPAAVDGIIRRLMAKRPEERISTPRELIDELDGVLAKPTLTRRDLVKVGLAASFVVLFLAAVGAVYWKLREESKQRFLQQANESFEIKDYRSAVSNYSSALNIDPSLVRAYRQRGRAWSALGVFDKALVDYQQAQKLLDERRPKGPQAAALPFFVYDDWARILATSPREELRDGKAAVNYATRACELTRWGDSHTLTTLAASHAEAGDFAAAVGWQERAIELAPDAQRAELRDQLQQYVAGLPAR